MSAGHYRGPSPGRREFLSFRPDGHQTLVELTPEEWVALIRDAHQSYVTWE
jgi:hypothetical protein